MNPKKTRKSSSKASTKKKDENTPKCESRTKSKFYVANDDCVTAPKEAILPGANKFNLTRKLSQIYTKFSGSRESIDKLGANRDNKNEISRKPEHILQRSYTLDTIQLRHQKQKKENLNFLSRLENLEELENEEKTESDKPQIPLNFTSVRRSQPQSRKTSNRLSLPPSFFAEAEQNYPKPPSKLERSNSFISHIKRKISFNEPKSMKSEWANSLQNLQQIDNMVSYEDLSFVDYDKFNQYEDHLNKMSKKVDSPTNPNLRRRSKVIENIIERDFEKDDNKTSTKIITEAVNKNVYVYFSEK